MAIDAMDIDTSPPQTGVIEPERKRKHKNKDQHSSPLKKKKRRHEIADEAATSEKKSKKSKAKAKSKSETASSSIPDSPYTLTTASLYLPLSPISISPTHALASLLAEHLSPLLLTYYPPLKGIVLAYSNASISSTPPSASSASNPNDPNPQPLTLATTANEYGVLYVYLTATFLVFRPQRGQILEGWVNVQSEGFLGAVVLNLFSVGIERKRLPTSWKWVPPGEEGESGATDDSGDKQKNSEDDEDSEASPFFNPEKEHFKPVALASDANPLSETIDQELAGGEDDDAAAEGYFQSVSGHRVRGTVKFRVVDIDVIPGTERERGFMSIEGTMLTPEEEAKVIEDERNGNFSAAMTPHRPTMSGALPFRGTSAQAEQQDAAEAEPLESPVKKKEPKAEKEKKTKTKSKKKEK
ncbi:hypothetical protein ASPWEDRAFT_579940 [Aspergillus wentii DTO 134E9]|uniref:DNA-directed RNA polymerase subunit n=1 Tax=Aspergillus wentii DTO 134E9 TaxID=1073089 RepID=A0A1L9RHL8_ASPWE|nr:uncharacterized protein ASPWEDRAFT_579940 [Aspergillus wentii DTO 134E9]KAI9925703.1 hypothetical protein MW887_005505 [Aspergillus wentii]OJJ34368.1 hypothetical protein ASPWEDRAFT_579940 [Aspergillus wentii DTO 134E9]